MAGQLVGKTFLVTGATDGIGRHTAEKLARAGASVIIHGRNPTRIQEAAKDISNAGGQVHSIVGDFSSFADVRRLSGKVKAILGQQQSRLSVLVNNAGTFEEQYKMTADGLETTWQVNVAAPYLLVSLLLDVIEDRIVNVASISAASSIDFGNLQQERGYNSHAAYSLSKLANIMFSHELAARLAAAGRPLPTSNSLDPGTVNTKMLYAGWGPIGIPASSANDQFYLATEAALASTSGEYFISRHERRAPPPAYDEAARRQLWDLLQEQTGAGDNPAHWAI